MKLETRLWDKKNKKMIYAGDDDYLVEIDLNGEITVFEETREGQIHRDSDDFVLMYSTTKKENGRTERLVING